MADYRTRLIILSNEVRLKNMIVKQFKNEHNIDIFSEVYFINQLSQSCIKNRKNIIIIDYEQPSNTPYIKSIIQKYNVLVISLEDTVAKTAANSYKTVIRRPNITDFNSVSKFLHELTEKIRFYIDKTPQPSLKNLANTVDENSPVIAIGSSTGGTEALLAVIQNLKPDCPPVLVVQHLPDGFSRMYADRIDKICPVTVVEAAQGDMIKTGTVYIAPAGYHMKVVKRGGKLSIENFVSEKINGVRPAADVLFSSVAQLIGRKAIGVILTGMGSDGAKGLYEMHQKGARTVGQNAETCVVYGMPKAAFQMGAVDVELPLDEIAGYINKLY